jgi:hypothetical protein
MINPIRFFPILFFVLRQSEYVEKCSLKTLTQLNLVFCEVLQLKVKQRKKNSLVNELCFTHAVLSDERFKKRFNALTF